MPYNGSGTFVRIYSWLVDKAAAVPITASRMDGDANDIAAALSDCITRDGQSVPTADLPMGGHSLTGIRAAVATGEPMEYAQGQALIAAAGGSVSNRLQNASFLVNQRAVSGSVAVGSGVYGHDRWKGGAGGAAYTSTTVGADVQVSIGAGSLQQVVLGTDADSASMTLSNAGTAQGRVYPLGGSVPSFAACPVTVTSLTPGTAVVVEFSTGTVLRPQLETGAAAHAYSRRTLALDTLACQALYEIVPYEVLFYTAGGVLRFPILFRARKSGTPTLTNTVTVNPLSQTLTPSNITIDGFTFSINTGSTNYAQMSGTIAASCEP